IIFIVVFDVVGAKYLSPADYSGERYLAPTATRENATIFFIYYLINNTKKAATNIRNRYLLDCLKLLPV
ncbi:MAG: hypothetical protein LBV43_02685, partial [Prevotella sp.]|nr:hypothetical protein [Prevotella sp.]